MKLGIGNKLSLSIEISVLLLTLFATLTTYVIMERVFEQQTITHLESVSDLKLNTIRAFMKDISVEIESIKKNETFLESVNEYFVGQKVNHKNTIISKFRELTANKDYFSEVFVINRQGEIVVSTNLENEGKIKLSELYFIEGMKETYIQDYFFDISSGEPSMIIGTPITDKTGMVSGVLAGRINVYQISELMANRSGLGETGETILINSFNIAVTDLLKEQGVALKKTVFLPQITECLNGKTTGGKNKDYHGDTVLGYYKWFPELRSCMVTKVDYSEAIKPIREIFIVLVTTLLVGGLLMGLINFLIVRRIVRPIKRLHESMIKIKSGDFDVQSEINSRDEIGDMAQTFNDMAKELKLSYAGMEEKVKAKTIDLENKIDELNKLNRVMIDRELKMVELKTELDSLTKKESQN